MNEPPELLEVVQRCVEKAERGSTSDRPGCLTAETQRSQRKRRENPFDSSLRNLSVLCASAVNQNLTDFDRVSSLGTLE
jgi:hypothetical protein